MARKIQRLGRIEFTLRKGKSLVVSCSNFEPGLERVVVGNEKRGVKITVLATSGSRFKFESGKTGKGTCDFFITNNDPVNFLRDLIKGKFWSQFNWGDLIKYQKNKKFSRKVNKTIDEVVN